ncbi:hypothetical protein B0H19DRAFT_1265055 [Mycena capillaripes]|nr:hypothetical protein B0H19DRAFT_1265055 [Mycena capillaripes]
MAEAYPEVHEVIDTLENIYSLTQKDRTPKTSALTSRESWRFRRAAYRTMLYRNLSPASHYDLDYFSSLGEDTVPDRFIRDTFIVVASSNNEPLTEEILDEDELYNLFTEFDSRNTLNIGYFATPLENIWDAREVEPPEDDEPAAKYILNKIVGAHDTCSQCATRGGLKLFTEANWNRLLLMLSDLRKNKLKTCLVVTRPFVGHTENMYNSDAQGPWIAGMFALKETPGAWDGWEREMSYCEPCLIKSLEDHVWKWFLQERIKAGWVPPENSE